VSNNYLSGNSEVIKDAGGLYFGGKRGYSFDSPSDLFYLLDVESVRKVGSPIQRILE
jgi:hypothetical protein